MDTVSRIADAFDKGRALRERQAEELRRANKRALDLAATVDRYRATLRQIADSGNSMNAHLARSVLENEHGNG